MPTADECRRMIFNVGVKLGISPKLIATRLLSEEDKNDMLSGLVDAQYLEQAVRVWSENDSPDYVGAVQKEIR